LVRLHPRELMKPISIEAGKPVKLEDMKKRPPTLALEASRGLDALSREDFKDLVVRRLEMEPRDKELVVLDKGAFTIDQLIEEVKEETDVGKVVVESEKKFMKYLLSLLERGEIE
jgi:hypothetical protein